MHSGHNASGYFTVYGDEALQSDHFSSRLSFGDTQTIWARTGYLGFLRRTELTDASGGEDVTQKVGSPVACLLFAVLIMYFSVLINAKNGSDRRPVFGL